MLDLDSALKERQGELQQRAQLVPHKLFLYLYGNTSGLQSVKHCVLS